MTHIFDHPRLFYIIGLFNDYVQNIGYNFVDILLKKYRLNLDELISYNKK